MKKTIQIYQLPTGHKPHMSGSGIHKNNKHKRNSTKSAIIKNILKFDNR